MARSPRRVPRPADNGTRPAFATSLDSAAFSWHLAAMVLDIKICGLKTADALAAALDGGASHVGFIFFGKSPRNVAPEEAGRLRRAAMGRAKAVAVTVDADDAFLDRIVAETAPDMLQLHGHETPERVAGVRARYRLPVMKALGVRELAAHLAGEITLEEAIDRAQRETRRYAKRQVTWFRHQMEDAMIFETGYGAKYSTSPRDEIFAKIRQSGLTARG